MLAAHQSGCYSRGTRWTHKSENPSSLQALGFSGSTGRGGEGAGLDRGTVGRFYRRPSRSVHPLPALGSPSLARRPATVLGSELAGEPIEREPPKSAPRGFCRDGVGGRWPGPTNAAPAGSYAFPRACVATDRSTVRPGRQVTNWPTLSRVGRGLPARSLPPSDAPVLNVGLVLHSSGNFSMKKGGGRGVGNSTLPLGSFELSTPLRQGGRLSPLGRSGRFRTLKLTVVL